MKYYCMQTGRPCENAGQNEACMITACTKTAVINKNNNTYLDTPLAYSKTPEEELEEQRKISLAENYLEGLGVKVKTEYGNYYSTYFILKDLGEYLSKNK